MFPAINVHAQHPQPAVNVPGQYPAALAARLAVLDPTNRLIHTHLYDGFPTGHRRGNAAPY